MTINILTSRRLLRTVAKNTKVRIKKNLKGTNFKLKSAFGLKNSFY